MNNWYNRINNVSPVQQNNQGFNFQNPMQKAAIFAQAMQNPAAFVKKYFPDIPEEIMYDSNQVLNYIQKTRGISNEQLNKIANQSSSRW